MPCAESRPQHAKKLLKTYSKYIKNRRERARKRVICRKQLYCAHSSQKRDVLSSLSSLSLSFSFNEGSLDPGSDEESSSLASQDWDLQSLSSFSSLLGYSPDTDDDDSEGFGSEMDGMESEEEDPSLDLGNALRDAVMTEIRQMYENRAWRNGWCFVDGTFIPLAYQPYWYGESYFDRKSCYSLNVQIVLLPNWCIIDFSYGHVGSTHDATAWEETRLFKEHESLLQDEWIWADSAYPIQTWVVAPYKKPDCYEPENEEFNKAVS
ncbi:hypothetical protein D9758_013933 [Tetrapyrgos nigripes]|uniref:DDE Tnp4 domain-containing protein n=1 Tax=Tetrapyrgos nigripes TaxID=182062 RepID=A0A8H5FLS5_9AGAR|nr:hypothetical protein D9758_013933 [Tetrapyrgos nigripes]